MGLRERRYAYRDFITPKQTRKKVISIYAFSYLCMRHYMHYVYVV